MRSRQYIEDFLKRLEKPPCFGKYNPNRCRKKDCSSKIQCRRATRGIAK